MEAAILAHQDVIEVAAYAVPADVSEDEIMVALVWRSERVWGDLVHALSKTLPHYMVPRYFRALDAPPRTQNAKVRKEALRSEGVTPDSWDREADGLILKAHKIRERR